MSASARILVSAALAALVAGEAQAVTAAGPWQQSGKARVRLVAATLPSPGGGERLVAGVHIELEPGWKTYWRTPGDSGGMPPELDWDMSQNVATAKLFHPAPHRFADALGISVGYKDEVVLPISIMPRSRAKPVDLSVGVVFGICKDICIPVDAELKLSVPTEGASDPAIAALIERYDAAIPRKPGEGSNGAPSLAKLERTTSADGKQELVALVRFAEGSHDTDLFIEAADYGYIPVPVRDGEEGGLARFRIHISKADKGAASPGKSLVLTMVSSLGSSEAAVTAP
jgi:DsbC/DsbD-like thiol-disulfide interchange protein